MSSPIPQKVLPRCSSKGISLQSYTIFRHDSKCPNIVAKLQKSIERLHRGNPGLEVLSLVNL